MEIINFTSGRGLDKIHCVTQNDTLVIQHIESAPPSRNPGYAASIF